MNKAFIHRLSSRKHEPELLWQVFWFTLLFSGLPIPKAEQWQMMRKKILKSLQQRGLLRIFTGFPIMAMFNVIRKTIATTTVQI